MVVDKRELRSYVLSLREALSDEDVRLKSLSIMRRLEGFSFYARADVIMAYMDYRKEVMTSQFIEKALSEGKRIALPLAIPDTHQLVLIGVNDLKNDIALGFKGIREPKYNKERIITPEEVDLVLVPGVVFDERGYRIGYGGGYYDRFLRGTDACKVGLAFELQIHHVPEEEYDIKMDYIITEDRIMNCNREE